MKMRLGIRRKLIGTFMLVGLFPLAMSLIVILGGGATLQLRNIGTSYDNAAADCANQIAISSREELNQLVLISRLTLTIENCRDRSALGNRTLPADGTPPQPTPEDLAIDAKWKTLKLTDEPLKSLTSNPLAERLQLIANLDSRHRELIATDVHGRLIATTSATDDFFQADEDWWQIAYDGGKGKLYMSSVKKNPATGVPCIEFVVPVYDSPLGTVEGAPVAGTGRLVGILKDKIDVSWVDDPVHDVAVRFSAAGQIIDTRSNATVYPAEQTPQSLRAETFYIKHAGENHTTLLNLFTNELIIGSAKVDLEDRLKTRFTNVDTPHWLILISKPSEEAMTPVYTLAITVALIGVALIIILFILGVAIANREIIMPIIRLREATAAVGRGELNIRLMSPDQQHATFRTDELGELARDFDEMTRQLQRNVNALARSNEAKRRFMELAGHELRTPVTYILSASQLAQRQIQQITAETPAEAAIATTAKTGSQLAGSMGKISAKAGRLSKIIDNLLKLVNSDQFVTKLNKSSVDMRALILQVTADARPFLQERKQNIAIDVPENLPSFEGDRDKLEDVLTNLLSNAIRFSPDGSTIKVAAHETVEDMLEILIEDAGAGIPSGDLANLFEPFYTGSDILHHHSGEHEYKSKGIGLGLAIVRRFVEIHGGIVRAHSVRPLPASPGQPAPQSSGTQFQILLPLGKNLIPNPPGPGAEI